jgi:hypothetical protein
MLREAVKAGYYESPAGANFPKIQILTIEGLLEGAERPRYPDLMQGGLMLRKPKREMAEVQLSFGSIRSGSVQTTEEFKGVARRKGARVARGNRQPQPRLAQSRKRRKKLPNCCNAKGARDSKTWLDSNLDREGRMRRTVNLTSTTPLWGAMILVKINEACGPAKGIY